MTDSNSPLSGTAGEALDLADHVEKHGCCADRKQIVQMLRDLARSIPPASQPAELGLLLTFSMAYLDGVMEGEPEEVRKHWTRVSAALAANASQPAAVPAGVPSDVAHLARLGQRCACGVATVGDCIANSCHKLRDAARASSPAAPQMQDSVLPAATGEQQ